MRLATFWRTGPLRNIETLCLASWVEAGAEVDLYSFGPVTGVPEGVRLLPASDVLSESYMELLVPLRHPDREVWQPMVNYSDLFRMKLMEQGRGMWLDGDVLLFRPFEIDTSKPFFAWEDSHRIGSPVFYLPPDNPMIADYNRLYDSPTLMPHWLGWKRGVFKPLIYRLTGQRFTPPDLGITIYGNDAFTRLATKHGQLGHAIGTRAFYAWNGKETAQFYKPGPVEALEEDPGVIGLHVHYKGAPNTRPPESSLYARMVKRLGHRLPPMNWIEPD
ncbi:hypothetical protein [Acidimangrovimonas sediminis]|uniref:hypothetical protein n=1 Tax=Acidimangrovimonas sediminis TaxID=2056283 RepID=UPI000C7F876F|nr:hypothetical protein [Acidimangrovimonas sediminis]